jgi:phosphoglycerate dehydrogenase-like enzyme
MTTTPISRAHVHVPGIGDRMADLLRDRRPDLDVVVVDDRDELVERLPEVEVLMAWRPPTGHWRKAPNLRLVQVPAAGVDSVLPAEDLADVVVVCNATGAHNPHMPEFAIAMLLSLAKGVPGMVRQQQDHVWRSRNPIVLHGTTLGVIGLGTIGEGVAAAARGLGMRVVGVRRSGGAVDGIDQVVTPDRMAEVLPACQGVVVVTPLTPDTRGLVDAAALDLLPDGALLVDVSRGGVVDPDAVVAALRSGKLAGAALDVFETEPLPEDSPLWDEPGLLITPHNAGLSPDYFGHIADIFVANIAALDTGSPCPTAVDRTRGY